MTKPSRFRLPQGFLISRVPCWLAAALLIAPMAGFPVVARADVFQLSGDEVSALFDKAKASVVQVRAEAKDYIDIDALLTHTAIDLATALSAARAIYGTQFNPQSTLKALCYFDEGNLRHLPQPVRDRLVKAACEVDLARLPMITVPERSADHNPESSR